MEAFYRTFFRTLIAVSVAVLAFALGYYYSGFNIYRGMIDGGPPPIQMEEVR